MKTVVCYERECCIDEILSIRGANCEDACFLSKKLREYELSGQLLRSGTSIGANIEEALGGASRKDFANKLNIAYKEARETKYWLRLMQDSEVIESKLAESFLIDCEELLKLLYSILQTTRGNHK